MNSLLNHITQIPGQYGGRSCICGTRICVSNVLEMLAEDVSAAEILKNFPDPEPEDIQACLLSKNKLPSFDTGEFENQSC